MEQRKTILLLGVPLYAQNMGLGALLYGSLNTIFNTYPDAKVKLLEYSKDRETTNFDYKGQNKIIEMINISFSKRIYSRNHIVLLLISAIIMESIQFSFLKRIIMKFVPHLKEIEIADFALSIAGGDSFSDIYGFRRFLYTVLPKVLVLVMHKDLLLLPQTLGPFKGTVCRYIAKYVMLHAKKICTRDFISQKLIKTLFENDSINVKLNFNYDVGFLLEPRKPVDIDIDGVIGKLNGKLLVGLNISGLLFRGGYTKDDQFQLGVYYPQLVRNMITWIIEKQNVNIILVPHVFGDDLESDVSACKEIFEEFRERYPERLFMVGKDYNQSEIKYIIGFCNLFIGSRMHSCIAALSQNIPTIGLAYSEKFYGVFETIGVERFVINLKNVKLEEVCNIIGTAIYEREIISNNLKINIERIEQSLMQILEK